MAKEVIEKLELIASRVPPGDETAIFSQISPGKESEGGSLESCTQVNSAGY